MNLKWAFNSSLKCDSHFLKEYHIQWGKVQVFSGAVIQPSHYYPIHVIISRARKVSFLREVLADWSIGFCLRTRNRVGEISLLCRMMILCWWQNLQRSRLLAMGELKYKRISIPVIIRRSLSCMWWKMNVGKVWGRHSWCQWQRNYQIVIVDRSCCGPIIRIPPVHGMSVCRERWSAKSELPQKKRNFSIAKSDFKLAQRRTYNQGTGLKIMGTYP
jgi:hypothetical protein